VLHVYLTDMSFTTFILYKHDNLTYR